MESVNQNVTNQTSISVTARKKSKQRKKVGERLKDWNHCRKPRSQMKAKERGMQAEFTLVAPSPSLIVRNLTCTSPTFYYGCSCYTTIGQTGSYEGKHWLAVVGIGQGLKRAPKEKKIKSKQRRTVDGYVQTSWYMRSAHRNEWTSTKNKPSRWTIAENDKETKWNPKVIHAHTSITSKPHPIHSPISISRPLLATNLSQKGCCPTINHGRF